MLFITLEFIHNEWECKSAEVASTANTSDNDIGIITKYFHLLLCLKTNNGMVHHNVI